jgi:outer membrane protein OmpA-like peptidoglycan-associated protein
MNTQNRTHTVTLFGGVKKTNPFAKAIAAAIVIGLMLFAVTETTKAQSVEGRIAFGFDAGGNKLWGNFPNTQFGFSGDLFIRWNIFDWLSLHGMYNAGLLRWKAPVLDASIPPEGVPGTVNTTRHGGWDLALSYNVFPEETFVPYFMLGLEALNFEPKDASANPLPNNARAGYNKNAIGGIVGLGFEMYVNPKVTFNGKVLLHFTGTDWIDDYTNGPPNNTQDAFLTFGLGFSYYIFAPMLPVKADDDRGNRTTTNITNNYTTNIIKYDTVVVMQTDTVYKTKILKNTIYNFPGTLFIVNTDEFNSNVADNMQNLRNIKTLVNQCPELKVEIQGHASHEGTVERNQELSDMRARKIKRWLIDQGVDPNKIVSVVGLGTSDDAVYEPTNSSPGQLEAARVLNRRIAVKVVEGCQ